MDTRKSVNLPTQQWVARFLLDRMKVWMQLIYPNNLLPIIENRLRLEFLMLKMLGNQAYIKEETLWGLIDIKFSL